MDRTQNKGGKVMSKELMEVIESGIELEKRGLLNYLNFAH